ncbi:uncharacterized protein LOC126980880 isoform X2 [Eriocheir sinensis]|uniref:uncharacterized protein LOC126980880 isoform X2 n=1 Tax=Eriocheir sinensis TaxID=95602 RepID=UPI0021C5A1D0|nr:uncharacterized protein LOC126980880 isoform X2 [Eriocheir sinensis]
MLAVRAVWSNIPTCPPSARLSPSVPGLPAPCLCVLVVVELLYSPTVLIVTPHPLLPQCFRCAAAAAMVNAVHVARGCGRTECCDGEGEGSSEGPGLVNQPTAATASAQSAVQFSRQNRSEWTRTRASALPLLRVHSCTNNSHPDLFTELQEQQDKAVVNTGHEEQAAACVSSSVDDGGGTGKQGRRHSAEDPPRTPEGGLARHVWSHRRIARSLSREGFFPTPNEHHSALLRPLAALGDLSAAYPDLPARLQYLTDLLTHRRPRQTLQSREDAVLSPEDSLLLTTIARLHLRQQRPPPPVRTSTASAPTTPDSIASSGWASLLSHNVNTPTTPDSIASSGWASLLSLNVNTATTTTSEWPSRTSSVVSIASSLPEDDNTNDDDHDENLEEARAMAGGDLVAPLAHHYDHHAYHIYYGGMKSVGRGEGGSLQPRLTRELAMSPDYTRPKRLDLLLDMPPVPREASLKHAWNAEDRSLNIFVKDDKMTFHRHPVAQSTDCIRGRVGYTRGLHVWEIHWSTRQRGTHAVVGVATDEAPLHSQGYQSLVGSNDQSWGWDLGRNKLYHNAKQGNSGITYPSLLNNDETFVVPDKFFVVLDMDEGTLAFVVEGQYLGVAFRGLKGKKLYPIVSAVWGHCEITIRYIGGLDPEPLPLMDLCRRVIRQAVGKPRLARLEELNLPPSITQYLLYHDRR